jgi:ABC-type nitrate/sulfonate/bicarbonate transport system permease component
MRALRRPRARATALAATGVALILGGWQIVAVTAFTRANGSFGAIPPPGEVARRAVQDLADPGYWSGLSATASSALIGYAIAALAALILGVVVMLLPWLDDVVNNIGVIAACAPVAAISPIVVLLSPTGSRAVSITLAVLAVEFPMIVGVLLGLRAATSSQVDLVYAYGGSEWTAIRTVRIIAAVPSVIAALKIGAPAAFLGAMTGEFFAVGVDTGIGRLLLSQQYVGDYVGMWAIALLATLVSALGYAGVALVARLSAPWTSMTGGRR